MPIGFFQQFLADKIPELLHGVVKDEPAHAHGLVVTEQNMHPRAEFRRFLLQPLQEPENLSRFAAPAEDVPELDQMRVPGAPMPVGVQNARSV